MKARPTTATLPDIYKAAAAEHQRMLLDHLTDRVLLAFALTLHDRGHTDTYICKAMADFYEIFEGYNDIAIAALAENPNADGDELNRPMFEEAAERGVRLIKNNGHLEIEVKPHKRKKQ